MKDDNQSLFDELINAIQTNNDKLVTDIIIQGVDVEKNGNQALHLACQLGHHVIVKLLIDADANLHQNNSEALWLAVTNRHAIVTATLLCKGADILDRNGSIWEEAIKPHTPDQLSSLVGLGIEELSNIDFETQLDKALTQDDFLLAEVLASSLPKGSWPTATIIALDHGNKTIAKLFLDNGVDFDQDDEKSAEAYYLAWSKGCKSLLPQIYKSGATISGALEEYIYVGYVSKNSLDVEFLTELLQLSNFDIKVCEDVTSIAISNKFFNLATETIKHLANSSSSLSDIFHTAILRDAKELYPLFMTLKASISFTSSDLDWLNGFVISNSTDRNLLNYLLAHTGPNAMLEYSDLIDKAVEDSDWPWVKKLLCYGERPSHALHMTIYNLVDTVEKDKAYQFSIFLEAAELAGGWAAANVAKMYMEGIGVEINIDKATHWHSVAALDGRLSSKITLTKILARDGKV